jgi:hypothetical protein
MRSTHHCQTDAEAEFDLLEELSNNPDLLFMALEQPIAFNPVLVDLTQSLTAGLLLSMMTMDEAVQSPGQWTELSAEKIYRTTRLRPGELKGARQRLRDLGLLYERQAGSPAKAEYRLNFDRLKSLLVRLSRQGRTRGEASPDSQALH